MMRIWQRIRTGFETIARFFRTAEGRSGYYILPIGMGKPYAIHEVLKRHNHDRLSRPVQGGGGGGHVTNGPYRFESEGLGYGSRSQGPGLTAYGGGQGSLNLARRVWQGRFLRLWCFAGFGGGGVGLASKSPIADQPNMAKGGGGSIVHAGLSIDLLLPQIWRLRPYLGLRLGYQHGVIGYEDPQVNLNGPYLRLLCGADFNHR